VPVTPESSGGSLGGRFPWRFPAKRGAEWWFNPWKNGENMVLEAEKLVNG